MALDYLVLKKEVNKRWKLAALENSYIRKEENCWNAEE